MNDKDLNTFSPRTSNSFLYMIYKLYYIIRSQDKNLNQNWDEHKAQIMNLFTFINFFNLVDTCNIA